MLYLDQGFDLCFVEGKGKVRATHIEFVEGNPLYFLFPPQILYPNTAIVSLDCPFPYQKCLKCFMEFLVAMVGIVYGKLVQGRDLFFPRPI